MNNEQRKKLNSKITVWVLVLALAGAGAWYFKPFKKASGSLDQFAMCLAEKGVTMYGTDWCAYCKNEKKAFGDSFQYVPYVECTRDPGKCLAAGIQGYPTWIFPASQDNGSDGWRREGEMGLQKLSQESGCPLASDVQN